MPTSEAIAAAANTVAAPIAAAAAAAVRPTWYAITTKGDGETEIRIYEDIGMFGVSAKRFTDDLEKIGAEKISVRINSYGGEAFDGIAIHNALRAHPAAVTVHVDGIAASAASIIAMAGDEVRMADNAFLMIHEAAGGVFGGADDMQKYAEMLDKLNDSIATTYQARAGKSRQHWRDLMAEETWFTAEEARAEGLADAVEAPAKGAKNRFDFKVYNHAKEIPAAVLAAWGKNDNKPAPEDSQRCGPPPAITKESSHMSDSNKAAPAPTPAAPSNGPEQQETRPPTQEQQLATLRSMTNAGFVEQGRKLGFEEGERAAREKFDAILAACPGKPQIAIDTFRNRQDVAVAKLAFDAEARADQKAAEITRAKDAEIERLNALLAIGGSPGVVLAIAGVDDSTPTMEPKAQAEWEWENKPEVRKTARTKDIYVLARAAELDGTHRSFSRASAN